MFRDCGLIEKNEKRRSGYGAGLSWKAIPDRVNNGRLSTQRRSPHKHAILEEEDSDAKQSFRRTAHRP